ncbi:6876_t:CDS:1, partial [Cetraspora pellucida]
TWNNKRYNKDALIRAKNYVSLILLEKRKKCAHQSKLHKKLMSISSDRSTILGAALNTKSQGNPLIRNEIKNNLMLEQ